MQVEAGGHTFQIDVHESPPPRRVAILLHGLAGTGSDWDAVRPAWARHATTAVLDLPGHGATRSPSDYHAFSFDTVADALWNVADALRVQAPLWGGYSMGARLLLYFAIRHPGRVGGLVLESPHMGIADRERRAERAAQDEADAQLAERQGLEAFLQAWHARPVFDSRRRKTAQWGDEVARKRKTNRPEMIAAALRGLGLGTMPDLTPRLKEAKAPTIVIAGTLDAPYLEIGRRLAEAMPDARFKAVANAGHAVHRENPEGYSSAVDGFLSDLVRREPTRGM